MSEISLRPVDLVNQPAKYQERYKIVHKLYDHLVKLKGEKHSQRWIKLAVMLEAHVAKLSKSNQSYRFTINILIRDLVKHKGNINKIVVAGRPLIPGKKSDRIENRGSDASIFLENVNDILEELKKIILSEDQMVRNGYITRKQIEAYDDGMKDRDGKNESLYVDCFRCMMKFKRTDIKRQVTCKYHPSKKIYNFDKKLYEYPCCGETSESVSPQRLGCQVFKHHVFKDEGYSLLSKISPFVDTQKIDGDSNVISIDCEMGFTTLGYEMIRLTMIDFFTSQTLFDKIARPIGEIIDLNSEYSGIHEINENNSISYEEILKEILGPKMINKNSILVGHGFENDLNVMRLTHNKCIDTSVMFLRKGKYKCALKDLAFRMLGTKIQMGEHDSAIDAITTMNIVKKHLNIPLDKKNWGINT